MWFNPYNAGFIPEGYTGTQAARAGGDCGCGGPRGMMPGPGPMPGPMPGPGPFPPGPGPFPPGPGPFPPGPGPFPPGPGPFPPGPGPFPPGPGPFPPGPGPFPPGPGPFPPGPGPFPPPPPPFPFPFPFPFPIPFPIPPFPGPGPFPRFVTVVINGGPFFPWVTNSYTTRFFPGITIFQALAATGVVRFGPGGRIVAVNGVVIGGSVNYILRLNGRPIPVSLLNFPLQPGDAVSLQLTVSGTPREDQEQFGSLPEDQESQVIDYDDFRPDEESTEDNTQD